MGADAGAVEGEGLGVGFGDAGGGGDAGADAAVDLHHQGDLFLGGEGIIPGGVGLLVDAVRVAGAFPEFLGEVGGQGGQHQQGFGDAFPPGGGVHGAVVPDAGEVVGEFHQGGDGGVEFELVQVVVGFADGLVEDALGGADGVGVGGIG